MNNNTERTDRYLQQEMTPEERASFEGDLMTDSDLKYELEVQRSISEAAYSAGLKAVFEKEMKRKKLTRGIIGFSIAAALFSCIFLLTNIVKKVNYQESTKELAEITSAFIRPPLPGVDVPFTEFSFDAEKGDTLFIPSGSVVYFPPSALTDAAGNLIKGKVDIRYREFPDPLAQFISGIPMEYDSAGVKYSFESSGMCEINAYQKNKPLFVNPRAKPEISLTSSNKDALHNLYYLDTVARRWNYLGKDKITEVKDLARQSIQTKGFVPDSAATEETPTLIQPVKPVKASYDHQSFRIEIEPGSYEELSAYNNLKFEVMDESNFRPSDAEEHWDNVKLARTTTTGMYTVTFINAAGKVSYKVRPVLEGADYDAALKIFQKKQEEYNRTLSNRLRNDKQLSDSIALINKKLAQKMRTDREDNDRMNAMITERNKKMRLVWEQRKTDLEKQFEDEQKKFEEEAGKQKIFLEQMQERAAKEREKLEQIQREAAKFMVNGRLNAEIIRTFPISNFGLWNCDRPGLPGTIPLFATYTDSAGQSLQLVSATVIYKGYNGYKQFNPQQIGIVPGRENMIWGIRDSSFFYFTYRDFAAANIRSDAKGYEFKMRKAAQQISSYEDMKALLGVL